MSLTWHREVPRIRGLLSIHSWCHTTFFALRPAKLPQESPWNRLCRVPVTDSGIVTIGETWSDDNDRMIWRFDDSSPHSLTAHGVGAFNLLITHMNLSGLSSQKVEKICVPFSNCGVTLQEKKIEIGRVRDSWNGRSRPALASSGDSMIRHSWFLKIWQHTTKTSIWFHFVKRVSQQNVMWDFPSGSVTSHPFIRWGGGVWEERYHIYDQSVFDSFIYLFIYFLVDWFIDRRQKQEERLDSGMRSASKKKE
jgi:hypothetical protein